MALVRRAVGGRAVPQVVVRKGHGPGLDHERHLAADVGVRGHAVRRRVAELGAGDDDGRPHVGRDVGRVVQPQEAVEQYIAVVEAVLVPAHVRGVWLLAVPVAMRLHLVVWAEQADEGAGDGRMVEHLPELGHGFGDGVAGVVV